MVSDSVLVSRLHELLRSSDLETSTAASIRRRLEEEFTVDLYARRAFIREQIDNFLQSGSGQNDGAEQDEEENENAQNDAVEEDEEQRQGKKTAGDGETSEEEASDEKRSKKKKKTSTNTNAKKKGGGGGFTKPSALSPQLQKICGVAELGRCEVVKKMWAYIKEHNLQNPENKRQILCDESLHGIFRVKSIDMFQMSKALSKHIWPLDGVEVRYQDDGAEQDEKENENAQTDAVEEDVEQQQGEKTAGDSEIPEDEEASDEGRSKKRKKKTSTNTSTNTNAKKKGGGGGFCKPSALSPQLQKICGVAELSRTEVVKKMWAYIKEHNLQNPNNRREILCDESLHGIFRVKSIDMFQMNKALSNHIWPLDGVEGSATPTPVESSQRESQPKRQRESSDKPKKKEKPEKEKSTSALTAPQPLSDALVKFFGTGENELSRADVVKRMWQYIKENELQDPSDKRMVLCDDKLKELFGVDSFHGLTVSKLLTSHFIKTQG